MNVLPSAHRPAFPMRALPRSSSLLVSALLAAGGLTLPARAQDTQAVTGPNANLELVAGTGPNQSITRRGMPGIGRRGRDDVVTEIFDIRIFVPPEPPRLGAPLPDRVLNIIQRQNPATPAAASSLSRYAAEIFYMPLASRLDDGSLTARQSQRIDAYLLERQKQVNVLRARIDSLEPDASPAARESALAALAATQTPLLAAQEKEADAIRTDILDGNLLAQITVNWNAVRRWRLGVSDFRTDDDAIDAQILAIIGTAYYQERLSVVQRRLFHEIAIELEQVAAAGVPDALSEESAITTLTDNSPLLFFSPELSRVRLAPTLPQELLEKIARYEQQKSAIKRRLNDVVVRYDAAVFGLQRTRAFKDVVEGQDAELAELEKLAEEIRRDLVPHPLPRPAAPPPLPASIGARISALTKLEEEAEFRLQSAVLEIQQSGPFRVNIATAANGDKSLGMDVRGGRSSSTAARDARRRLNEMNDELAGRYRTIRSERRGIRDDLGLVIGPLPEPERARAIEDLIAEYGRATAALDEWVRQQDYRDAVLLPGLSPEQRRLLFEFAIAELGLPLPESRVIPQETFLSGQFSQ